MTKMIVLSMFILLAGIASADDSVWEQQQNGTSVWNNMESGKVNTIDATITNVQLEELRVSFKDSEGVEKTLKLCSQDRAINRNFYTEADRALALNLRIQPLREAKKSKQTIKLGIRGPWSPCVFPLDV